jgi:hypothetical protein
MTGEQSRQLKVGDRVSWGDANADTGTVTGTSWSEVIIVWDHGNSSSMSHNDMARVERAATNERHGAPAFTGRFEKGKFFPKKGKDFPLRT